LAGNFVVLIVSPRWKSVDSWKARPALKRWQPRPFSLDQVLGSVQPSHGGFHSQVEATHPGLDCGLLGTRLPSLAQGCFRGHQRPSMTMVTPRGLPAALASARGSKTTTGFALVLSGARLDPIFNSRAN
jgi:hypothetical protein